MDSILYWIEELTRAIKWHKDTKKWLDPNEPFDHVRQYNLILDWQDEVEKLKREQLKREQLDADNFSWQG